MKHLFSILMLFVLAFTSQAATFPESGNNEQNRECIIQSAYSTIGVTEVGHNAGQEVERYLSVVEFGPGAAWCGAHYAYNLSQCMEISDMESYMPMRSWAYTPNYYNNAKSVITYTNHGIKQLSNQAYPKKGDAMLLYNSKLGRVAHIGTIDVWHAYGDYVITIEGNTNSAGSREGDQVAVKYRDKRQIYAVVDVLESINQSKYRI
jgi:hypothetical protein